jgi:protocatechuate 3,4-dioxygenase beta subunit
MNRRAALKASLGALTGAVLVGTSLSEANAKTCRTVPAQAEGPFYPVSDAGEKDNDLTAVKGRSKGAKGQVAYLYGRVVDDTCMPVANAVVEIWQACYSGKYNHPGDVNTAKLDPNFQYRGISVTDEKGRFSFKTVRPGAYPASSDWVRPPHIHFKVSRRGYHEVTSQLYFAGDALNDKDFLLQRLDSDAQKAVTIDFKKPGKDINAKTIRDFPTVDSGALVGEVQLGLKRVTG